MAIISNDRQGKLYAPLGTHYWRYLERQLWLHPQVISCSFYSQMTPRNFQHSIRKKRLSSAKLRSG